MMKMLFIPFFLVVAHAEAQIALPSIFPDLKSINPSVVALRKHGQYTLNGSHTQVDKQQKLKTSDGSPITADIDTKIKLTNANFFRGGRGKGLTTEFSYDQTNGTKHDVVAPDDPSPIFVDSKAHSSYVNLATAMGELFGFSVAYVNYKYDIDFQQRFGTQNFSNTVVTKYNILSLRPGTHFSALGLHWGAYYDHIKYSGSVENNFRVTGNSNSSDFNSTSKTTEFPDSKIIGFGVAKSFSKAHIELSHEMMPFEKPVNPTDPKPKTPSRTSAILEMKLRFISLGVKTSIYKNTFTDLDRIINSQMLFGNMTGSSRMENSFNFEFGADKGLSLGGGVAYSKFTSKEKSNIINTTEKQETSTKLMGLSVKVGYLF